MHVFFDEQTFVGQEQGGISRYFAELAAALGQADVSVHVFGGITRNLYLSQLRPAPNLTCHFLRRRDRLRINKTVAQLSGLWRRWDFSRLRKRCPQLIYHATQYAVDPWIAARADATFLTIFDMIGELLCDEAGRVRSLELKRRGGRLADFFFCISSQTERDFVRLLPEFQTRTAVTPLAASLPAPTGQELATAKTFFPYLLLVGNRAGYKNGLAAVKAFCQLAPAHPKLKLVCFGGEPVLPDEQALLQEAGVQDRTCFLGGHDQRLAAFYTGASALLYPSRYEGFGLPLLEAMRLGCPVVTTRSASLPEVAGEAAIYADPNVPGEFAAAADRFLRDQEWRQSWVRKGRARAEEFSWSKTARLTRAGYEATLKP